MILIVIFIIGLISSKIEYNKLKLDATKEIELAHYPYLIIPRQSKLTVEENRAQNMTLLNYNTNPSPFNYLNGPQIQSFIIAIIKNTTEPNNLDTFDPELIAKVPWAELPEQKEGLTYADYCRVFEYDKNSRLWFRTQNAYVINPFEKELSKDINVNNVFVSIFKYGQYGVTCKHINPNESKNSSSVFSVNFVLIIIFTLIY